MRSKTSDNPLPSLALVLALALLSRLPAAWVRPMREPLRAGADFVIVPFSSPLARLSGWLVSPSAAGPGAAPADLQAALRRLEQENHLLKARIEAQAQAAGWYERLRPLIEGGATSPVPATVAGWNGQKKDPRLALALGRAAGVAPRQVVVGNAAELVGVVGDQVDRLTCEVILACRPGAKVQGMLKRQAEAAAAGDAAPPPPAPPKTTALTPAQGPVAAGDEAAADARLRLTGSPDGLWLADAPPELEVAVGDGVVLDDPHWPFHAKGFRLGVVERIVSPHPDPQLGLFFRQLVIRPAADPGLLGQVLVLVPKAEAGGADSPPAQESPERTGPGDDHPPKETAAPKPAPPPKPAPAAPPAPRPTPPAR